MQPSAKASAADNIPLAVGTIIAVVLTLSLGDALIKLMGDGVTVGLWQLFLVRSLVALPLLLAFSLAFVPVRRLVPRRLFWTLVRSMLLFAMWLTYYASLPHLPFAVAAAGYYTLPLFIVAFAAVFAGERVGRQKWIGVTLGFLGILLVLRPGGDAFVLAALLPVLAASLFAAAMILTRTKCRNEHPATLAIALNILFVVLGAGGLLLGAVAGVGMGGETFLSTAWTAIGWNELAVLSLLGALIAVASLGSALAYQIAPSSVVGTFDFAYVGFALVWGVLFFGEIPTPLGLLGIGLIVLAGILAVRADR